MKRSFFASAMLIIIIMLNSTSCLLSMDRDLKEWGVAVFAGYNSFTSEMGDIYDPAVSIGLKVERLSKLNLGYFFALSYKNFGEGDFSQSSGDNVESKLSDVSLDLGLSWYFMGLDKLKNIQPYLGFKIGYIYVSEDYFVDGDGFDSRGSYLITIRGLGPVMGCNYLLTDFLAATGDFSYFYNLGTLFDNYEYDPEDFRPVWDGMPYHYITFSLGLKLMF